jgi:hypothetical protein
MITIQRNVRFEQKRRAKKASAKPAVGRVPRVARLMALAIRFDQMIRDGVVADQAEVAHLGHVTRARLTQIMNLTCLAPDIQEEIICFFMLDHGRARITERDVRPIAATLSWTEQRQLWQDLRSRRRRTR